MSHPQYIAKVEPNLLDSHHHQPSKGSGAHEDARHGDVRRTQRAVIGSSCHRLPFSR
jgi:hypothetical protein